HRTGGLVRTVLQAPQVEGSLQTVVGAVGGRPHGGAAARRGDGGHEADGRTDQPAPARAAARDRRSDAGAAAAAAGDRGAAPVIGTGIGHATSLRNNGTPAPTTGRHEPRGPGAAVAKKSMVVFRPCS